MIKLRIVSVIALLLAFGAMAQAETVKMGGATAGIERRTADAWNDAGERPVQVRQPGFHAGTGRRSTDHPLGVHGICRIFRV